MSTLALDCGGTRIKAGIVSNGVVLESFVIHTGSQPLLEEQLERVKEEFLKLPLELRKNVEAVACALPCFVSADHLTVTRSFGKYDDSLEFDLEAWARKELDLPVILENDARAAAIGEWQHGVAKAHNHVVTITLGTGIGSAVITDGKPLHGALGVAGNLAGHQIIHPGGRRCACGMNGCIEAYISTWALPQIAAESPLYPESDLVTCSVVDYFNVFTQASRGDALAIELRDRALLYWSVLLVNLIYQYDPEIIVLGGGIMAGKDQILPPLKETLKKQLHPMHHQIKLEPASLGDSAALLGLDSLWNSSSN